jgi:hypothetical protein
MARLQAKLGYEKDIPYAITAGFHDLESDLDPEAMIRDEAQVENSHTEWNPFMYRGKGLHH